jgi:hypothetical protein
LVVQQEFTSVESIPERGPKLTSAVDDASCLFDLSAFNKIGCGRENIPN